MGKIGTIYKIENLVSGKVYVGQTTKKPTYRLNSHKRELECNTHKNTYLQNAFNKYGLEKFRATIIESIPFSKLDEREIYWINYYKNKNGVYNIEGGGKNNHTVHDITRKKISEISKLSWQNTEYQFKMKIRSMNNSGANNTNARKIICINDGLVFDSLTYGSEEYLINIKQLSKVVTGKKLSCYSSKLKKYLQFAYYEEGKQYGLRKNNGLRDPRKVICINTKEVFDSTWQAAKTYNISQGSLVKCLKGGGHSLGKDNKGEPLLWEYLENYSKDKEYKLIKNEGSRNPKSRPVVCVTTGEYFESARQAELKHTIANCKISMVCRGKRKHAGRLPDGAKLAWKYA